MSLFESILLGLIQGLTEFLPVSSSGHLALAEHLLGLDTPGLGFEVWLHLATLVAVLIALRKDIFKLLASLKPGAQDDRGSRIMILGLVVGTIPAAVVGVLASDAIEHAFGAPKIVGVGLLLTATLLMATRLIQEKNLPFTVPKSLVIGLGQALAVFPGVSRSGSTLVAGLGMGLAGPTAARFSFLLSVPAILGASVFQAGSLVELGQASLLVLGGGFSAAAISGYVAIKIVWRIMEQGRLWIFAPYCVVLGLLALFAF